MIDARQYWTATNLIKLGNGVTYFRNLQLEAYGLTSVQGDAIRNILHNPGITASELKNMLGLSQSTVAGIISRLESKHLIEKGADEGDGRKAALFPTEQCLDLQAALKEDALKTQQCITRGMDAHEKEEFDRLIQIALNNLNDARKGRE